MPTPLQVENRSYQVPQMNYELPKNHDPRQKDHNKRHRRSHSRNNSHDQLIYREGKQYCLLCSWLCSLCYYFVFPSSSSSFAPHGFMIFPSFSPSRFAVERWTPWAGHSKRERRVA
jgi:hypothetical protein